MGCLNPVNPSSMVSCCDAFEYYHNTYAYDADVILLYIQATAFVILLQRAAKNLPLFTYTCSAGTL